MPHVAFSRVLGERSRGPHGGSLAELTPRGSPCHGARYEATVPVEFYPAYFACFHIFACCRTAERQDGTAAQESRRASRPVDLPRTRIGTMGRDGEKKMGEGALRLCVVVLVAELLSPGTCRPRRPRPAVPAPVGLASVVGTRQELLSDPGPARRPWAAWPNSAAFSRARHRAVRRMRGRHCARNYFGSLAASATRVSTLEKSGSAAVHGLIRFTVGVPPCGTRPIRRSPRGQRPLNRTILILAA